MVGLRRMLRGTDCEMARSMQGREGVCLAAQMLMDLGPNVYSEDFEQHFLAKAAEFYQVSHCFNRLKPAPNGGQQGSCTPQSG